MQQQENNESNEYFIQIIDSVNSSVYWKDRNGVYLGCNEYAAQIIGVNSSKEIIGKTDYNLFGKPIADNFRANDLKVMNENVELLLEENGFLDDGNKIVRLSSKKPLYNKNNEIVGIIGNSIDITAEKEAMRLELENRAHKNEADAQNRFRKIVGQAVHDLQSPLSSLQTIVKNTLEIPEQKRIALRHVAISIGDITNHLLNQYTPQSDVSENNKPQLLLVSTTLSEILSDRRHKYKDLPIQFEYKYHPLSSFAFIKVEPSNFRRMISNLINNAVESIPKKGGKIEIGFVAHNGWIYMNVVDTGKGIPSAILHKIESNIAITAGKKDGHGLGLTQVQETIERNHGEFHIFSKVGKNHGTRISLYFPLAVTPDWIAEEINLTKDDLVIILDDDNSIHEAWDSRFSHILEKVPTICIKHFTQGQAVIDFIHSLSAQEQHNIYLLSDYELIKQDLNGLQVIEQSKIKRATMVTSHHMDIEIRKLAVKHLVKILPKELAHNIPLKITQAKVQGELSNVHMVFVDDDKMFVDNLIADYYSHLVIDVYTNPFEFLDKADQYPLNTKIILDNNYYYEDRSYLSDGISIATQLHEKGFTKLYLISGEHTATPEYLSLILKTDETALSKLDKL